LRDHRPTGGEIRRAPVAEPARAQPDVLILGDGELAARAGDVVAIGVDVLGDRRDVAEEPAVPVEERPVRVVEAAESELEAVAGVARQLEQLEDLRVLAPRVRLVSDLQVPPELPPVADRRVERSRPDVAAVPEVEDDRLPRREELEPLPPRQAAIGAVE